MAKIQIFEDFLEENTLIDIVIPPYFKTEMLVNKLISNGKRTIILDLKGNLQRGFLKTLWNFDIDDEQSQDSISFSEDVGSIFDFPSAKIDYAYIEDYEALINRINSLHSKNNYLLIIDSIVYVCDIAVDLINPLISKLWELIYSCKATIVTINHYRIEYLNKEGFSIPRMGKNWENSISYQIQIYNTFNNKYKYKIRKNDVMEW